MGEITDFSCGVVIGEILVSIELALDFVVSRIGSSYTDSSACGLGLLLWAETFKF